MFTLEQLHDAEQEAKRFLTRVKELQTRLKTVKPHMDIGPGPRHDFVQVQRPDNLGETGPHNSAVRRASLDLSRALAVLRNSRM